MTIVRAGLLAGPTALAFASGGFFTGARLPAAIAAWALLALAVAVVPAARPARRRRSTHGACARSRCSAPGRRCRARWAPSHGGARDAVERVLLYLPALAAGALRAGASAARRAGPSRRWPPGRCSWSATASPGGCVPTIVHLQREPARRRPARPAADLLERDGRAGGDRPRPVRTDRRRRDPARASCGSPPPRPRRRSGWGCTSASRAARSPRSAARWSSLVLLVPTWPQLRAAAIALGGGRCSARSSARRSARCARCTAARAAAQGAVVLVLLLGAMAFSAWLQRLSCREDASARRRAALRGRARWAVIVLAAALALAPYAAALGERGHERGRGAGRRSGRPPRASRTSAAAATPTGRSRSTAFGDAPLKGVGAGGYATEWLRGARSPSACATRTRCTSRRSPSSGSSASRCSPRCSPASSLAARRGAARATARWRPDRRPRRSSGRCTPASTGTGRCRR